MAETTKAGKLTDAAVMSPNFGHLAKFVPQLATLGMLAERYVFDDPPSSLAKLRLFGESMAQEAAASVGLFTTKEEHQVERLRRLRDEGVIDFEVADLFHVLRKLGNDAIHSHEGTQREALHGLRVAWKLGAWFQVAFHRAEFRSRAFVPPPDPRDVSHLLQSELEELRAKVAAREATVQNLQRTAQQAAELQQQATESAQATYADMAAALELAEEAEARVAAMQVEFGQRLKALQAQTIAAPKADVQRAIQRASNASKGLALDESETRLLIDAQLRTAGWEADTTALSYKAGARPCEGRNMAIAEWPTHSGPADYLLFVGLMPVGVVEAKRQAKDVSGAIEQSKRYSRDYYSTGEPLAKGAPWDGFHVPFLFATNGRPFLRQLRAQSGIWFLDARRSTNHARPLEHWYTPDGLMDLLKQNVAIAEERLRTESSDYLPVRGYQRDAIQAVEQAIADGQRDILLAMATGTGKTRMALCLIYRLIKSGRFRRILFLVDRTALGEQALEAFADVRLESLQSLTEIYEVKGLGDLYPGDDTRLHVATVQGMVRRIIFADEGTSAVPVDWYDCVIVDECHRGYALDQEMSESDVEYRSEIDYISKYRRVLDHFDAVRIGLTATPALHTTEIFGPPVYTYGYRQAVIDGHLVDHEPPIQIQTELNQGGIHWKSGETVPYYNTATQQLELYNTPDEIDIDVEGFNTKVLTENFNRVVCEYLAKEIDPGLDGKTMIFCATDSHADTVVMLLKQALATQYGEVEDDAVMKITGAADKPLQKLRLFKNERLPKFAVTVDLLTTGIDVPQITNLVFLRRVKSRILYEQMLGRATRLCPEIGKEFFRIYDAVDLYAALQDATDMKPVVVRPKMPFTQLVEELTTVDDLSHREQVFQELLVRLQARVRRLKGRHEDAFVKQAGMTPSEVVELLREGGVQGAVEYFASHEGLAPFLDHYKPAEGRDLLVSEHDDQLIGVERGYGQGKKPEEYLADFKAFIESNQNEVDALLVVTQRPRDLTRKQLRELKLRLDAAGFPEIHVQRAVAQMTNQDIAASIIGFIRQQALGCALVPYEERVNRAVQRILASQDWSSAQRDWLNKLGAQLKSEVVVDRDMLDDGQFRANGGFKRLNKVFDGQLEEVLGTLKDEIWNDVA